MEITYLGHASFKLKNKNGVVIVDPFAAESTGLRWGKQAADIVTISHAHADHSAWQNVSGTAQREKPFVIREAGEYEVGGISVFGVESWHDKEEGALRGLNIIFTVLMDGVNICHLGDLAHPLTDEQVARIGEVDVLMSPVGGKFSLNPKEAIEVMNRLEPKYFIPMHYRTAAHNENNFGELEPLSDFLNEYGIAPTPVKKLEVVKERLPEEMEVVIFEQSNG